MKKQKFAFIFIAVFLFILVFLVNFINAFGVSTPYWGDTGAGSEPNPLIVLQGETGTFYMNIQNIGVDGYEDILVKVEIKEGSEFLTSPGETYNLDAQTSIYIPIEVNIPVNTIPGTYQARISFSILDSSSGGIGIKPGVSISFPVIVLPADQDNDGVLNSQDLCPDTVQGEAVNYEGCSIAQICVPENNYKNHGEYVSCISNIAYEFLINGFITESEKDIIVSTAAQSIIGKK